MFTSKQNIVDIVREEMKEQLETTENRLEILEKKRTMDIVKCETCKHLIDKDDAEQEKYVAGYVAPTIVSRFYSYSVDGYCYTKKDEIAYRYYCPVCAKKRKK